MHFCNIRRNPPSLTTPGVETKTHGLAFSVMGPVGGGHEDFVVHCGSVRSHSLHRKTR
jgi:hypothetical protein